METSSVSDYAAVYRTYLENHGCKITTQQEEALQTAIATTRWEEPENTLDFNNIAVMALIEAEQTDEPFMRTALVELATDALKQGAELGCPLCRVHLAIILGLTGELSSGLQASFSEFIDVFKYKFISNIAHEVGLVYFPRSLGWPHGDSHKQTIQVLEAKTVPEQALLHSVNALMLAQLAFYNATGLRSLQLAVQLFPGSELVHLKLGIANIMSQRWEGLFNLHQVLAQQPSNSVALQSLYLAYKDLNRLEESRACLNMARQYREQSDTSKDWEWSQIEPESPYTWVKFESDLLLCVEASFKSIVTGVLLAENDWFEGEMEFWRHWLQPGMTVVDVGANVGVYTFSAAKQVGPEGKVIAVEPFSGCVACLEKTREMNQLDWVQVCAGAASDRNGTVKLSLESASELNQVVEEGSTVSNYEEVDCFTLDDLLKKHDLDRLDFLKIDAEGHEVPVLRGSPNVLASFRPMILYENVAGKEGDNLPVAEFLIDHNYLLFSYQPFVRSLTPINALNDIGGRLNVIAIPKEKSEIAIS